jgi:hypothetical protein
VIQTNSFEALEGDEAAVSIEVVMCFPRSGSVERGCSRRRNLREPGGMRCKHA